MADCIFCEIVARKAVASVVFEDELSLAFMDINPINKGHVLLIPKQHFETIDDCEESVARHLMSRLKELNKAVSEASKCEGVLNEIMNGEAAGQEIFHLHIHIVPRFRNDGFGWRFPEGYRQHITPRESLDIVAAQIRQHV